MFVYNFVYIVLITVLVICIQTPTTEGLEVLDTDVTDVTNNVDLQEELKILPEVIRTLDLPHIPELPNPTSHKFLYELGLTNEERFMNFTHLACKYKRNVTTHHVKTRDGYILTLFRLHGKGDVVFIMHGMTSSADDWITPGPNSSIPYLLNDAGYDVWLGNGRGNTYSRKHEFLSPDHDAARFWNFSWHEIGLEDVPAMIDYVLLETNRTTVKYICHSQGGTSFLVAASLKPEYNKKFSIAIGVRLVSWSLLIIKIRDSDIYWYRRCGM
ncbi:alpha/beta hydrolase fold domain-containing protein [Phthorimaea operculella]|nr:alpha/beta hydrolase fold domain-containing protein [Phthorimaea operculella]